MTPLPVPSLPDRLRLYALLHPESAELLREAADRIDMDSAAVGWDAAAAEIVDRDVAADWRCAAIANLYREPITLQSHQFGAPDVVLEERVQPEPRVSMALRLPVELHERLKIEASGRDVSVNWLITRAIDQYLAALHAGSTP